MKLGKSARLDEFGWNAWAGKKSEIRIITLYEKQTNDQFAVTVGFGEPTTSVSTWVWANDSLAPCVSLRLMW